MRKLFFVLCLSSMLLGSDKILATKIYISIAKALSAKGSPQFYLHQKIKFLDDNEKINRTASCKQADIVIINKMGSLPQECQNKMIFTTKYRVFLDNENVVGAFFWQKGRPNIVFRRSVLEANSILLDKSYDKYIE